MTTTEPTSSTDEDTPVELVLQLGYASAATHSFDRDELIELLERSRRNNAARGVTGMLLYHDGSFLQVLEGTPVAVESLYARIGQDPRHTDKILLFRHEDVERTFGEWTMGFHIVDPANAPPGLNRFLENGLAEISAEDGATIHQVLLGFRDGRWRRTVDH
jgi:hypothetical protein